MGFTTYMIKKVLIYFSVLLATLTILYIFTFPILQEIIAKSINFQVAQFSQTLFKNAHSLNSTQIQIAVEKYRESLIAAYGLNQPIIDKYFIQMYNLIRFDFGTAYFLQAPSGSREVSSIIAYYLPNTILLFTTATIIFIVTGTIIGLLSAKSKFWEKVIAIIAVIHSSIPTWWLGFVLIAALAYAVKVFPPGGMTSVPPPKNPFDYGISVLYHMSLPLITIFIVNVGGFAYIVRSLVTSIMKEDFVITAKARGLPDSRILYRHVLRSASPSIATQAILALAGSLGGSLTTEVVFEWPGVGLLTYVAITLNDLPVILGITYVLTIVLLVGLFLGELVYGLLDPRIKVGE
ncbi:MAG: ABC transporter permease [Saccharolobus sp.]|uniref:Oligopeptide ABC transporter, permease protein n=3 Tax=Saccharolobus TaxID=2100760 RepID=A0A8F5BPY4_SACSH|nr:ABC transporter permease [Saccharolobus shibatae]MCH4814740.1 ABC transporter permease [Saccharolobus shibatae]QXJ29199.1 Oligopeptide ABC transporter, permease protein [Saccharolobus shibatae B12]QXJ35576.1 Oligopeptide ABC transporter, permease protein [Saccharolobus shibatae]